MSMNYDITPQRQAYIDARGYTILTACPGSGKTTSIVKKTFDCITFFVRSIMEAIQGLSVCHLPIKPVMN